MTEKEYKEWRLPGCVKGHSYFGHVCYCIPKEDVEITYGQDIIFTLGEYFMTSSRVVGKDKSSGNDIYIAENSLKFTDKDITGIYRRRNGLYVLEVHLN